MAGTSEHPDASNPRIEIDDMIPDESSERALMLKLINNNDFSIDQAIEKLLPLTTAAAAEAFLDKTPRDSRYADALCNHAETIASIIVSLAYRIPHNQQSKLLEFIFRLNEVTVPDPNRGGVVQHESAIFWTHMPRLAANIADIWATELGEDLGEDENREFENMTAFVAQLSEKGFSGFKEAVGWDLFQLSRIFTDDYEITKREVRIMCIWFIYAPKKVWLDVKLRRKRKGGGINEFKPEFWPEWRKFLHSCQSLSTDGISDDDTQDLIKRALESMDKIEAAESQDET